MAARPPNRRKEKRARQETRDPAADERNICRRAGNPRSKHPMTLSPGSCAAYFGEPFAPVHSAASALNGSGDFLSFARSPFVLSAKNGSLRFIVSNAISICPAAIFLSALV